MQGFKKAIDEVVKELDEKEKRQDAILTANREIVRDCAKAIRHLHTGEKQECLKLVKELDLKIADLRKKDSGFEHTAAISYQEYVEVKALLALLDGKELPGFKDLGVPWREWLSGLADCVGELRRGLQLALREGDKATAERLFKEMNFLYDNLMVLKYSTSLVGQLKHKQDMVRSSVEQARSEMLKFG